jgi:uncharacterized OB-fold protein
MANTALRPDAWRSDDGDAVSLLGTRCGHCGTYSFPPVAVCPECWKRDALAVEALQQPGIVAAFTVSRIAQEGIEAPYGVAYVDFSQGVRLCGRLRDWSTVHRGSQVTAVAGPLRSGPAGELYGWMFAPASETPEGPR